jgi:hypothetical protein
MKCLQKIYEKDHHWGWSVEASIMDAHNTLSMLAQSHVEGLATSSTATHHRRKMFKATMPTCTKSISSSRAKFWHCKSTLQHAPSVFRV